MRKGVTMKDDLNFWRWAIVSGGGAVAALLGLFGVILLIPGVVLLTAAIMVATKLEDF
jgi:hypothetical protein